MTVAVAPAKVSIFQFTFQERNLACSSIETNFQNIGHKNCFHIPTPQLKQKKNQISYIFASFDQIQYIFALLREISHIHNFIISCSGDQKEKAEQIGLG